MQVRLLLHPQCEYGVNGSTVDFQSSGDSSSLFIRSMGKGSFLQVLFGKNALFTGFIWRKMTSGIYCIKNVKNGKLYIGQAVDIEKRWYHHKNRLNVGNHANVHLQRAWEKYGESSFDFIILQEFKDKDSETIDSMEEKWINFYNSRNGKFGYNIKVGGNSQVGENNLMFGRKQSKKTRAKISTSLKNTLLEKNFDYKKPPSSTSRFHGVCWNKRKGKWMAGIWVEKKYIYLGYFNDEILAAKAYDKFILENVIRKKPNFS